jgi:hypothetical protein
MIGFGLGKITRIARKGRAIDEVVNRIGGKSRKMNKRGTIDPQFGARPENIKRKGNYVSGIGGGKPPSPDMVGTYPKYPKSVNQTQPVTSPRKLQPHQTSSWSKRKNSTSGY